MTKPFTSKLISIIKFADKKSNLMKCWLVELTSLYSINRLVKYSNNNQERNKNNSNFNQPNSNDLTLTIQHLRE